VGERHNYVLLYTLCCNIDTHVVVCQVLHIACKGHVPLFRCRNVGDNICKHWSRVCKKKGNFVNKNVNFANEKKLILSHKYAFCQKTLLPLTLSFSSEINAVLCYQRAVLPIRSGTTEPLLFKKFDLAGLGEGAHCRL
jgi:hypothetical protein